MKRLGTDRYAAYVADREASGREWNATDQTQTVTRIDADREIADALNIAIGEPVYERARLVKDAGQPTHTLSSYYRLDDVEGSKDRDADASGVVG